MGLPEDPWTLRGKGCVAEVFGKHSGEGVLGKLIKTGIVRQWEVPEKANERGWPGGGRKALAAHGDSLAIGNLS